MLRKALWLGLSAGVMAAARLVAARIWRIATGEQPPSKTA